MKRNARLRSQWPFAHSAGNEMSRLLTTILAAAVCASAPLHGQEAGLADDLLQRVRRASTAVPGALPETINFLKFAESHRTYAAVIDGGGDEPFVSARTAFQVVYPDGSVMIDAGMDEAVHRFYGFGRTEPYWQDRNDIVQAALSAASLVVVTHEHGDHIAGVLRSPNRDAIAAKTILTEAQVTTLTTAPQLPEIGITDDQARDYVIVDYGLYLPVAPGLVLIEAAGHTPGHQMIFVQLADGAEYLFIGDIGWLIDNVTQQKLRPADTIERIGEDPDALMAQLRWLNGTVDEGIILVPSHDDSLLARYAGDGLLGSELLLPTSADDR